MRTVLDDTDALNIRAPPAIGLLLRPGDVVSETGALGADVTHSSHWEISCSGSSATRTRRNRWVRGFLRELDKPIRLSARNPNRIQGAGDRASDFDHDRHDHGATPQRARHTASHGSPNHLLHPVSVVHTTSHRLLQLSDDLVGDLREHRIILGETTRLNSRARHH